jgi:peroxiredoxin
MKTTLTSVIAALATFTVALAESSPEQATLTKVGQQAPGFSVTTFDGKELVSRDLKGKVVLLNFFATWCGPCMMEMPQLEREVWQKFKEKGLIVLAIGREHKNEELIDFQKKKGFTFPMAGDPNREVYGKFASQYIPRNVLIGKDGTILFQSVGFEEGDFQKMIQTIEKALR